VTLLINVASLFKLRIAMAISLSALAGMAMMPGPAPSAWQVIVLAIAVLLASASAGAFNQYIERDLDARMARTRRRPFVTGYWRAGPEWLVLIGVLLVSGVGAAALAFNAWSAAYVFLGAFVYGVVYTVWLKRRTVWNIVIGGLAGSFAVLAGAAAITPVPAPAPVILAFVLFLWTPPHFWSLALATREQYASAAVPMLPVTRGETFTAWVILGHTVALSLLALVPVFFGLGWLYFSCALAGGLWFVYTSLKLVRAPGRPAAIANFRASLGQLTLLLLGALGDAWLVG
jgi:heme o synthase